MNKNLHDKLEEAADNYANNVVAKSLFLREDYVLGVKEDFITGAEQGYKEAIKEAKEWMKNYFPVELDGKNFEFVSRDDEIIPDFETYMNELFGGESK